MLALTEAFGSSLRIQNVNRSIASLERSRVSRLTSLFSFGRPLGLPDWPFWKGIDLCRDSACKLKSVGPPARLSVRTMGGWARERPRSDSAMGGIACRKQNGAKRANKKPRADVSGRGGIVHRIYRAECADLRRPVKKIFLYPQNACSYPVDSDCFWLVSNEARAASGADFPRRALSATLPTDFWRAADCQRGLKSFW
jgi:hypothetical protein